MQKVYIDIESCGLEGLGVTIQYAFDNDEPKIHDIWINPVLDTLELIESFLPCAIIGFNLAFDFFHICKLYTTFLLVSDKSKCPEDIIEELADLEERARFSDVCLKPESACDIMLLARKGPLQSLMARDPIKIRRVPTELAWHLVDELDQRIKFDEIFFARSKKQITGSRWKVYDIRHEGQLVKGFKDVVLVFSASGALKNLYKHAFGIKEKVVVYGDIEVNRKFWPFDFGYAPYAKAVARSDRDWIATQKVGGIKRKVKAWPAVISQHILHWSYNQEARKYAIDDVNYTRRLYLEYFNAPEPGDNDSVLACQVAACRWHGYAINIEKVKSLREEALSKISKIPTAPKQARWYVNQGLNETERAVLAGSTKRVILEEISEWLDDDGNMHPAAKLAKDVLDARMAKKEVELYDKLIRAGRFHASFRIIGTLSSRMSGASGLNPQGIKHSKEVRSAFILADGDRDVLCGGDFKSFEVSLAAKVFDDPKLNADLMSGKKVHGIMGQKLNPKMTYEEVLASEGCKDIKEDWYDKGKKGFFLKCYFGTAYTFMTKLGIPEDVAEQADQEFDRQYTNVKKFQDWVRGRFGALSQPNGIGTRVEWKEPEQFAESFLKFRRYFMLEIRVMKALFQLAQSVPKSWRDLKIKVQRRERIQTAGGAVSSALYAAAFGLQGAMIRAAGNHYIQSPGAEITKGTQRAIWDLQPVGINKFIVRPMNIHDEIQCPTLKGHELEVEQRVQETVSKYRELVPLLKIDWFKGIKNWAEKKG